MKRLAAASHTSATLRPALTRSGESPATSV